LVVEEEHDSTEKRKKLFKNFDSLAGITQAQRLAATFVVKEDLRNYFDRLSAAATQLLEKWEKEAVNV
jgi:hypothetical protein